MDVHAHVLLPDRFGDLGPHEGYRPTFVRVGGSEHIALGGKSLPPDVDPRLYNVGARLKDLDGWAGDLPVFQVLSPPPFTFLYELPAAAGVALARAQNDAIASLVEEHPDRFAGLATLPLKDPAAAAEELDRAVRELGMKGVEVGTNVDGRDLDLPEFRPVFRRIQDLGIPILLHPNARPTSWGVFKDFYLGNPVGYPVETTIAVARLILGGVCEELPRLRFIAVHGGGFIPYQWGRLRRVHDYRDEARAATPRGPDAYLDHFYFDGLLHGLEPLRYLVEWAGAARVLLGSDYPFPMGDEDAVARVRSLELRTADEERILQSNAEALLQLKR